MCGFLSIHWFLFAGGWFIVNGFLHDVFVLRAHKGPYNRELLRLLMDGHVLLLSGAVLIICWFMARQGIHYSFLIALVIALGMIVYCAMIFPFLKSFVTLGIIVVLGLVSVAGWLNIKT
jgi:hypothetical protein